MAIGKMSFTWENVGLVIVGTLRRQVAEDDKGNPVFEAVQSLRLDTEQLCEESKREGMLYGIKKVLQDRSSDLKGLDALESYKETFESLKEGFYKKRVSGRGKIDLFRLALAQQLKLASENREVDLLVIHSKLAGLDQEKIKAIYAALANEGWVGKADMKIAEQASVDIGF